VQVGVRKGGIVTELLCYNARLNLEPVPLPMPITWMFLARILPAVLGVVSLTLGFLPSARAEIMEHLYEASVPVADQSDEERKKALGLGLNSVLVRVSGVQEPETNPVIKAALAVPEQYLQEFTYESVPDQELAKAVASPTVIPATIPPRLVMKIGFSPASVKSLLQKSGMTLWPRQRPAVLVWVLIEKPGEGRTLLAPAYLQQEAEYRGLALVVPMNDPAHLAELTADTVWQLDRTVVEQIGQGYGINTVLVGRVTQLAVDQWSGSWLFVSTLPGEDSLKSTGLTPDTAPVMMESTTTSLEAFQRAGLDYVVHQLISQYAIPPGGLTQNIALEVSGVESFSDYAGLLHYLHDLEPVRSIAIQQLSQHRIYCMLEIEGSVEVLQRLITLGAFLVSGPQMAKESSTTPMPLQYRMSTH